MDHTATVTVGNCELTFSDKDVVDLNSFCSAEESNPHDIHPWLLHDGAFTVAVVFASNLQNALDIAVDESKMDRFLIPTERSTDGNKAETSLDAADYPTLDTEEEEGITRLGNAGEPFDIETLGYVELQNPPLSFVALFNAADPATRKPVGSHDFA